MKKLLSVAFVIALAAIVSGNALAADVEHHRTTATAVCAPYVDPLGPTSGQTETVRWTIATRADLGPGESLPTQAYLYYTTDGSSPSGSFGVGFGTASVISATLGCSTASQDPPGCTTFCSTITTTQASAVIPAAANQSGRTIKYIVSGVTCFSFLGCPPGLSTEYFANGSVCTQSTDPGPPGCATVFSYPVTAPTAVTLRSFSAARGTAGTLLRWRTASELDTAGFNVYRGSMRLNRSLIAARGDRGAGASYRLLDRTARPGASYRYRLQVVDLDGSRHWAASSGAR